MILLDTNALLWLDTGHKRGRALSRWAGRLYVSPASLLEIRFLVEIGRLRERGRGLADLAQDSRWLIDEPPAAAWFETAGELSWTRDPFDRLIAAHAKLRGFRLATGDERLLVQLPARQTLEL